MTDLRKQLTGRMAGIMASAFILSGCAAEPAPADCWERVYRDARELRIIGSLSYSEWSAVLALGESMATNRCEQARAIVDAAAIRVRKASVMVREPYGESI